MKMASAFHCAVGGAILLACLAGCQNPYSQFYTNALPPGFERWLRPHRGEAQFFTASDSAMDSSVEVLLRRGYVVIGTASFEANARDYSNSLRKRAKEVQADIVLVCSLYARTMNGVVPLLTYHPGQTSITYSSGQVNANVYGAGGSAYGTAGYSGVATTTSPGTFSTNYVPMSVQRNSYSAVFMRKYHYLLGAQWSPLNDQQRRVLQRNTGLVVNIVVEGTPAFIANILPGDILLTLDGEIILSGDDLNRRTLEKAGELVKFGILRDGAVKTVELRLNAVMPDT